MRYFGRMRYELRQSTALTDTLTDTLSDGYPEWLAALAPTYAPTYGGIKRGAFVIDTRHWPWNLPYHPPAPDRIGALLSRIAGSLPAQNPAVLPAQLPPEKGDREGVARLRWRAESDIGDAKDPENA